MPCYEGKYADEVIVNAAYLGTPGKGILDAADEAFLSTINVDNNESNRRAFRELLFCTPGALQYLTGVILSDETLYQKTATGKPFVDIMKEAGVLPGIKIDINTNDEDTLADRCAQYYRAGARVARCHAVLKIGPNELSWDTIDLTTQGLARCALICQENGLVPIVEPEVLLDGPPRDIEKLVYVTSSVLCTCVAAFHEQKVLIKGVVINSNMLTLPSYSRPEQMAHYTLVTLLDSLSGAFPTVVFSSGGQTEEEATVNLDAINRYKEGTGRRMWALSFLFGWALQESALKAWSGKEENVKKAQDVFLARCWANSRATLGQYEGGFGLRKYDTSFGLRMYEATFGLGNYEAGFGCAFESL